MKTAKSAASSTKYHVRFEGVSKMGVKPGFTVGQMGIEPRTFRLQSEQRNHSATPTPQKAGQHKSVGQEFGCVEVAEELVRIEDSQHHGSRPLLAAPISTAYQGQGKGFGRREVLMLHLFKGSRAGHHGVPNMLTMATECWNYKLMILL
ncbi:conserved hypothetical protein [Culex quinquefasciatus]|nr:conserved hypothetical protein [Culex quinquefasciatus]|eukprot:XP_001863100.1 conserved hypothetical protein [Culex quinquefasciatus]